MKKLIKIAVSLVVLATVALSASSCAFIDEMRDHRMNFTDDTQESIEFRGKTYKRLPESDRWFVSYYYTSHYSDEDRAFSLSTKDVPLLLTAFSENVQYDKKSDVIMRSMPDRIVYEASGDTSVDSGDDYVISYTTASPSYTYYCSEENYERYEELLTSAPLTTLRVDWSGAYDSQMTALAEETSREILAAVDSENRVSYEKRDEVQMRGSYIMSLIACDSDMLVCETELYDVYSLKDAYYISYDGLYYLLPDSVSEDLTALQSAMEEYYNNFYYEAD